MESRKAHQLNKRCSDREKSERRVDTIRRDREMQKKADERARRQDESDVRERAR